jgi:methionyl aminopeptidase
MFKSPLPDATPMSVQLKSQEDIAGMRVAGRLAAELLDFLEPHVQPGITTGELDRIAHNHQVNVQHVVPATLNYAPPGHRPYPASICTSVNHVVCHGIPGDKKLKAGDIVNIDVTVIKDGWHGDTSRMFYLGTPSIQAKRLVETTFEAMWRGIRAVKPGARLAISATRSRNSPRATTSRSCGSSAVMASAGSSTKSRRSSTTDGPGTGMQLQPGMIFTIEPMINAGRAAIRALADGWTIVTADHSLSAQWEHTVLVTPEGYEVLTVSDGAPKPPAA